MKTITWILFGIIIIIGAIAIVITKLYYKKKEKKAKQSIEDELRINKYYAPNKRNNEGMKFRRKPQNPNPEVQRQNREIAAFSKTMPSVTNDDKIFDDYYKEPIKAQKVNHKVNGQVPPNVVKPNVNKQPNTPKTKEMEKIINSEQVASKISQEPMTTAHKEFIKNQQKRKLVIEEGSGIKIVTANPNNPPINTETKETKVGEIRKVNIKEITENSKNSKPNVTIEEVTEEKTTKEETPKEDIKTEEKVSKEEVSEEKTTKEETPKEDIKTEEKVSKEEVSEEKTTKEETPKEDIKTEEEVSEEDINLENTLNQIIEESDIESSNLIDEILKEIKNESTETKSEESDSEDNKNEIEKEEETPKEETSETLEVEKTEETTLEQETQEEIKTEENKPRVRKQPEFNKANLEVGETTLEDHKISEFNIDSLTKEEEVENESISPILKGPMKGAVESLKTLRSNLFSEETPKEEITETYDDYEEDEFYAITPLTAEEIKTELKEETATITPINEDNVKETVTEESKESDEIEETEVNKEINKKEETEAKEKIKAKKELDKLRKENTKRLVNSKTSNETTPVASENQVVIDEEVYNLKKGQNIMFIYKNETYTSTILAIKPGYVGVRYRSKNVWVKNSRIKKVFKY